MAPPTSRARIVAMSTSIGSIGLNATASLHNAAIEEAGAVVDAADAQREQAAGLLAMMKPQAAARGAPACC
jgi:hypothetical protein